MAFKGILTWLGLNVLGIIGLVVALLAFAGILLWTFTRPRGEIETCSRLWMEKDD